MKPKTIKSILAQAVTDYHDSALNFGLNEASAAVDTALAQIQQLLEECAPEKQYKQDEAWRIAVNKTIDQYRSNLMEKLR